jgi:hypothetical protein
VLDGEPVVIDAKGIAGELDEEHLQDEHADNDADEYGVGGDAMEDIKLNDGKCTSSWSLRALMKLKTCIMTNTLKIKVMCREYTLNY